MKKKYRIKTKLEHDSGIDINLTHPVFIVQVRAWWGAWVNVKVFYDPWDSDFARREAEELLDKLEEK